MSKGATKFTKEEQERIDAEVKLAEKRAREAEIEAEIRNKILSERRNKPGYAGY